MGGLCRLLGSCQSVLGGLRRLPGSCQSVLDGLCRLPGSCQSVLDGLRQLPGSCQLSDPLLGSCPSGLCGLAVSSSTSVFGGLLGTVFGGALVGCCQHMQLDKIYRPWPCVLIPLVHDLLIDDNIML